MKLLIALIGLLLIVSSCSHVYFTEPQPKGGERLIVMPEDIYGIWFGGSEGWQFNEKGITNINIETDSIGTIIDTIYETNALSDSLRIYKAKELYVIHSRSNNNYWEIAILKPMKNGDINTYYTSNPVLFTSAKGLKLEEANYYIDGELKTFKTLETDDEGSMSFENAVYSGQMSIKTLRKILDSIDPVIFKKDGSIYNPE